MHLAGTILPVGPFTSTVRADFDFETYSEAGYVWNGVKWESPPGLSAQNRGLKAVGVRNYVTHPTFEILSLAYDLKDGKGRRRWRPGLPAPQDLLDHVRAGKPIEAWNSFFEWCAWNLHCAPVLGWPPLALEQLYCAMSKSRASSYPGALDDAATVLGTAGKNPEGTKLIRKLTVPRNPTKGNPALRWTPITAREDFWKFYVYNEQDIVAEAEASAELPDLSPRELEIWRMDQRINFRGMRLARQDVENCISIIEQAYAKYNAKLREITHGSVQNYTEVARYTAWFMDRHGIKIDDLDEESVQSMLDKAKENGWPTAIWEALRIRQILAFGSVRKLYAMRSHMCSDDRIRDQYVYSGAATKLWNGRAVQPANLYSGQFSHPEQVELALSIIASRKLEAVEAAYGDALEVIASCLRSMIVAAPGNKLISADFTAIQAVVLACMAGEQWVIDVFRTHGKIYEAQASQMTGKPLQYYIDYKKKHGKHHQDRQDWGKLPVLSGGFGAWIGGWKRFGADKILGADENIKAAILKYRSTVPNIVEFWGGQTRGKFTRDCHAELYGLEGAAISAVLSPGKAYAYGGVVYQMCEDVLYCRPPSGGYMQYHSPRLEPSRRDYAEPWELELTYMGWNTNQSKGRGGWQPMKLYGGVLTQNVVANVSRERQADALLALDTGGYPIVMHTHDEGVAEVPDRPEYSTAEYTRIVRESHKPWASMPDGTPWPIKIPEAWEAYRYGKWEL